MNFGDATSATFSLSSTQTVNGLAVKKYEGIHTYAGATGEGNFYQITVQDSYRISNIHNIANSQTQDFLAESRLKLTNTTWTNSSVGIVNPCPGPTLSGTQVLFDPGFTDSPEDSLSFGLTNCYADAYRLPIGAAVNASTGVLSFSKDSTGLFAFCIKVTEWKKQWDGSYTNAQATFFDFTVDIPQVLGITEIRNPTRTRIYPNPVRDFLSFDSEDTIKEIRIFDAMGTSISEVKEINGGVNTAALSDGVYFVAVKTSGGTEFLRFVKVR